MTRTRARKLIRAAAFLAGLGIAAVAILSTSISTADRAPATELRVSARSIPDFKLSPSGAFITASDLAPSEPSQGASGTVTLKNTLGLALSVRVRALSSIRDLNDLLWIEVTADDEQICREKIRQLRSWKHCSFTIGKLGTRTLKVRAWLPPEVKDGYEHRSAEVDLEFRTKPLEK